MEDHEKKKHYTEQLINLIEKTRSNLDNALLRICALGIPLTVAFKSEIFDKSDKYESVFVGFIVSWALTVVLVVLSFHYSEIGFKGTKQNVSQSIYKDHKALRTTKKLNRSSLFFFFLGIACITGYAILHAYC